MLKFCVSLGYQDYVSIVWFVNVFKNQNFIFNIFVFTHNIIILDINLIIECKILNSFKKVWLDSI